MEILSVILFSLAVSVDGFGVGLAYGMRSIRISLIPLLVICITSAAAITISMYFGTLVASLFTPETAGRLGAFILIAVGFWIIFEAWSKWKKVNEPNIKEKKDPCLMRFRIPGLGIVIQILKEPEEADFDRSGNINSKEALFLGFALAMDALGAGFGAAVAGYQMFLVPIFVGIFKFVLVSTGLWLGQRSCISSLGITGSLLPGVILIMLGISQF
ncbi:sporulation membrane protein YtaF [Desulfitibacter alkalitolerans]|uniref:sporulation membrane protein YtaF n=1 Tax=Desulfitibacter alkalitolerans TaxID=264641 RepID=UPI000487A522|nr:sporulation membrane protein YtaF [Desulfitibacter alkalitolerans]